MKKCSYCGAEYPDDVLVCPIDQTPFEQTHLDTVHTGTEPVEPQSDVPPDAEAELCTSCLFPNIPDSRWCKRCGAPLSSSNFMLMPEAAQALGFVYRQAVESRPKLVVVVVIWIQFFTGLIFNSIFLGLLLESNIRGLYGFIFSILAVLGIIICVSMLFRVTRNYFKT